MVNWPAWVDASHEASQIEGDTCVKSHAETSTRKRENEEKCKLDSIQRGKGPGKGGGHKGNIGKE